MNNKRVSRAANDRKKTVTRNYPLIRIITVVSVFCFFSFGCDSAKLNGSQSGGTLEDRITVNSNQIASTIATATGLSESINLTNVAVAENNSSITQNTSSIAALQVDNSRQEELIKNTGGTLKVMVAGGFNQDINRPIVDVEWFWLEECITPQYIAGTGETALVTATIGLDLSGGAAQGVMTVFGLPDGARPPFGTQGLSYFCRNCSFRDVPVTAAIPLTEGVAYQFGPAGYLQGSGPTMTRLACQTMVQVVKVQG